MSAFADGGRVREVVDAAGALKIQRVLFAEA
jgi:hypothetical protein